MTAHEPEQAADEMVIELACGYCVRADATPQPFLAQLSESWGKISGRGANGTLLFEEYRELRLHTSCPADQHITAATGEALRALGTVLENLNPTPGVELTGVTVEVIPGAEHAAHLDMLAARWPPRDGTPLPASR